MKEYIQRDLEDKIEKYLKLPQIIAIIGPRRSGKTTLLLRLKGKLKEVTYISFEDQKTLDLFDRDIEAFCKIYVLKTKYLIIDEFHYAKRGGKNLKYIFDFYPGKKIIISGSSVIDLTVKVSKYLVGRLLTFNLLPFSFAEFLKTKEQSFGDIYQDLRKNLSTNNKIKISQPLLLQFNQLLQEYVVFGGYPEVALAPATEIKITLLNNVYSLYFLKEVKDVLGLIDDYKLKLLLRALALQIGNICQYQELSDLANSSAATVKKYFTFFEKTFISFPVQPFFTNKRTELVKNPKVYFFDTGLRNSVIDNFSDWGKRQDTGVLLENFAAVSLLNQEKKINFWRTKAKAEVDFIYQAGEKLTPVEIKINLRQPKISPSFSSFITKYQPKEAKIFSLNYIGEVKIGKTRIFFLPIFLA